MEKIFLNSKIIFIKNALDYRKIDKKYRSNSYIENYNKRIKQKLSSYLFGKSKTKISWPLFNHFIVQEENDYRLENIEEECQIEKLKFKNNIIDANYNLTKEIMEPDFEINETFGIG